MTRQAALKLSPGNSSSSIGAEAIDQLSSSERSPATILKSSLYRERPRIGLLEHRWLISASGYPPMKDASGACGACAGGSMRMSPIPKLVADSFR